MALVRTDYGLIYNTDGSLCATLLPEGGVAVTEGTTNGIQNGNFAEDFTGWTTWNPGDGIQSIVTRDGIKYAKIELTSAGENKSFGIQSTKNISVQPGDKVTVSFRGRGEKPNYVYLMFTAGSNVGIHGFIQYTDLPNGEYLGEYTWTSDRAADVGFLFGYTGTPKSGEFTHAQLEKKPFRTPFVDGTRPAGQLSIPLIQKQHAGNITLSTILTCNGDDYSVDVSTILRVINTKANNAGFYIVGTGPSGGNKLKLSYILSGQLVDLYKNISAKIGIKQKLTLVVDGKEVYLYQDGSLLWSGTIPEWGSAVAFNQVQFMGVKSQTYENTLISPSVVSPETVATWHSLDAPFFDPREILDPAAKPIQVQGSGGYMVIDKHGEKWVRNSDGKTVFQFDVNTGNAEYGGELSAKVITANMFREIRNVLPYTHLDSLDESNPIEFRFYIPTETIQIVSIKLSAYGERFRGYTKSAKVGGTATSETWKYEGGGRTEPGGEHTHTLDTSLEQTSSRSHTIVVEGSTGTAGEHQHASAGEHQHIIDTSSSETSIYGSLGGSTPERHSHSYNRVTGIRKAGNHTHPGTGNHSHSINISLGNDTHSHGYRKVNAIRDVLPHTHQFYLPEHKHNIAGHSHDLEFGIYQDTTPNQCHLYCDNGSGYGDAIVLNNAPDTTTPYPLCNELDLTGEFSGTGWKSIKFTSTRRGRINFQLVVKVDLEA